MPVQLGIIDHSEKASVTQKNITDTIITILRTCLFDDLPHVKTTYAKVLSKGFNGIKTKLESCFLFFCSVSAEETIPCLCELWHGRSFLDSYFLASKSSSVDGK